MSESPPILRHVGIDNVTFGSDVTIVQPANLYGCQIGEGSFVGPFVEIQKDVRIGKRCRIQSHAFICEFVAMGDDCFISHGVMFVNDLFRRGGPARGDKRQWGSTRLGNRVSIGTNSTILPVRVADDIVIGAGSVVTRDLERPGFYVGSPARFLRPIET